MGTELQGQIVVVIGGSAGIGFETARRARAEGARVIVTARNPDKLKRAAVELDALSSAAFDAHDGSALDAFFESLPKPIDQVMVTAGGPHYARLLDTDPSEINRALEGPIQLAIRVARNVVGRVRPGGSLLLVGGTGGRRPVVGLGITGALTAALPALTTNLALELAPIRVNLVAPGFVDTDLSAAILGKDLEARRAQLRATLPIRRVVGPADVAALAVHIMTNTALTGGIYDVDGGQQLV